MSNERRPMTFEEWWPTSGISVAGQPEIMNLALKEIAQRSWEACQIFNGAPHMLAEYNRGREEGLEEGFEQGIMQ